MRRVLAYLLVIGLAAGCAQGDDGPARRAATGFYAALGAGRTAEACALLSARAREGLETGGQTCGEAIGDLRLPGGAPREVRVYGDEAQVRLAADTVFLHRFGDRWLVHGAGCVAREGLPYRCEIGG